MNKFILRGNTSQDFATAMLNKPQNRKDVVEPFLTSLNFLMS